MIRNMLYEDPYFGPNEYSIYGDSPNRTIPYEIQWIRPHQILGPAARLFSDEMVSDDIKQGYLGNCWFISDMIALIEHPMKIAGLFGTDELEHSQGKYHIRLCKNGEIINVVIDDLIPCIAGTDTPIFTKSNWVDFWMLLLEKAYAKVHGSYLSLKGGFAHEAFMDLTGLPSFRYEIDIIQEKDEVEEFLLKLIDWNSKKFPMVASTRSGIQDNSGLSPTHCYTIIRVVQTGNFLLINLRNPWGRASWTGDFNPRSDCWTQEIIEKVNQNGRLNLDDGSFWMKYEDFLIYFNVLYLCNIELEIEKRERNIFKKIEGIGSQALWCYMITVRENDTEIVLGIHQEDERSVGVKKYRKYLDLGIVVMSYDGNVYMPYRCSEKMLTDRDLQMELSLPQGKYLITPISSGTAFTRPSDSEKQVFPLITEEGSMHPLFQSTIKDIFRRTDIHMNQAVNYQEFMTMYSRIEPDLTEDEFTSILCRTYDSNSNRLTLNGFYEFFMAQTLDKGEETIRNCLSLLGYDSDFYSLQSRAVVFTMHSNKYVDLVTHSLTEQMNLQAWMSVALLKGKIDANVLNVKVYKIVKSGGFTILAHNESASIMSITSDFSRSYNLIFSSGSAICENVLDAGSWQIIQHLVCRDLKSEYQISYYVNVRSIS
ncbi:unnamed protein product [Blepharisma stoltei]|uniref:Calpain catalytic domain-containing protein n=1 Tax=Blepharisma stoltei TaxID=1481888 RepID=A0AAU9JK27_9CILI|nr:unnamed protein product [Blepharisma stoltei]